MTPVAFFALSLAAAQGAPAKPPEKTVVLKIYPGTDVPDATFGRALREHPDIGNVEIDTKTRLVKLAWKKDFGDAFKLQKYCEEQGVPAVMWNPLRIPATAKGGATYKQLAVSLGKVKGMTRVDELKNGVLMWAEPAIDLDAVTKAAAELKMELNITTHEKMVLGYENEGDHDTASVIEELNHVPGVIRIDTDEKAKTITVLHALGWSTRRILPDFAYKRNFKVFEKTK